MGGITTEAVETLRRDGFGTLFRRGSRFLVLRSRLWAHNLTGGYRLSVDGVSASFGLQSVWELVALDYISDEERELIEELLEGVTADDVVWDVGSHVGVHACLVGQRADRVVAFEPYPPNEARLRENLRRNRVDSVLLGIALSDVDGRETMAVPASNAPGNQWSALLPDADATTDETLTTTVRTGDTVAERDDVPAPNVVKIDVEGASCKVLRGLERTLRRPECRTVFVEVHLPTSDDRTRPSIEEFGETPERVWTILEEYGFDVTKLSEREADYFLKATKPDAPSA